MKRSLVFALAGAWLAAAPAVAQQPGQGQPQPQTPPPAPQPWTTQDPVLRRIWEMGMNQSQVEPLAQALLDSIGPRLTASPGQQGAHEWAIEKYRQWGIPARTEQYGTWTAWRRGHTHVDLVQPRVRTLEGQMLAWSPGTEGPVTAGVVILPDLADSAAFQAWLPNARGKFVLTAPAQPTCRPDENWEKWGQPATVQRMKEQRQAMLAAWQQRYRNLGVTARDLPGRLEAAGAVGILTNLWSQGWGVDKIFNARTQRIPTVDLSCEDYGLVFRLAQNGQGPQVRLDARSENLGEQPSLNTLAEIRSPTDPNEYVMLSAHFDSWDGSSGATDNGTGTVVMMEAMRILKAVYPNPKRTILVGHWSGEEQGLNGSRGFVADNLRVVEGLQALFNQDNGTGRVVNLSFQGFTGVAPFFQRWLGRMPQELVGEIKTDDPGLPSGGGSDHSSFVCAGAPAFMLGSLSWDYGTYTWHTNRDTYDKIVFDEVRRNAVLTAMLAYLAAEEPERLPRARRTDFPVNQQTGQRGTWPQCQEPARTAAQSTR